MKYKRIDVEKFDQVAHSGMRWLLDCLEPDQDNCSDYCSGCPACKPEPNQQEEKPILNYKKQEGLIPKGQNSIRKPDQQEEKHCPCCHRDGSIATHDHCGEQQEDHDCQQMDSGYWCNTCNEHCAFCNPRTKWQNELKKQIEEQKADQQEKCKACYGKGWHSQIKGEQGSPDFIGDKGFDTGVYEHKNECPRCKGSGKEPKPPTEECEHEWNLETHHFGDEEYIECMICRKRKPPKADVKATRVDRIRELCGEGQHGYISIKRGRFLLTKLDEAVEGLELIADKEERERFMDYMGMKTVAEVARKTLAAIKEDV